MPFRPGAGTKTQALHGQRLQSWQTENVSTEPHIQPRKEESDASKNRDFKVHHWVVERTHSGMNRFRRLLTRQEKKTANYEAMLHFACGPIVGNRVLVR